MLVWGWFKARRKKLSASTFIIVRIKSNIISPREDRQIELVFIKPKSLNQSMLNCLTHTVLYIVDGIKYILILKPKSCIWLLVIKKYKWLSSVHIYFITKDVKKKSEYGGYGYCLGSLVKLAKCHLRIFGSGFISIIKFGQYSLDISSATGWILIITNEVRDVASDFAVTISPFPQSLWPFVKFKYMNLCLFMS